MSKTPKKTSRNQARKLAYAPRRGDLTSENAAISRALSAGQLEQERQAKAARDASKKADRIAAASYSLEDLDGGWR